ncbi:hypothetical protein PanWU01x14_042520, partial [Parasponia andersonii]
SEERKRKELLLLFIRQATASIAASCATLLGREAADEAAEATLTGFCRRTPENEATEVFAL